MARRRKRKGGFVRSAAPAAGAPSAAAGVSSALEQQALALLLQGLTAEAEPLLRQCIAQGQASASAYCNLAAICGMTGRSAAMIPLLQTALSLRPDYPEALSNLGIAYQEQGQPDRAIAAYRQALRQRPDYPEALCNLGSALQESGELQQAVAAYQQAIASKPDYLEAHANLALAWRALGDTAAAIAACRQVLQLRPHHREALLCLAQSLSDAGESQAALQACRQALALLADQPASQCSLATLLRQLGHPAEAIQAYRRALSLQPDNPDALVNLGDALKAIGHHSEAIACFEQALALKPEFPEALSNLGIVHQMVDDIPAAISVYRRAIALDPSFAAAHSNLGISLSEQGDYQGAIVAFREAIRLQPEFAEAHSNLGIALEETGQLQAAVDSYQQALQLQPDYPEAFCNLGNALHELGEIEGSLQAYQRAVALRADYGDARKNLSMALLLNGDYAAGWQAYEARFQSREGLAILNALPAGDPCDALPPPGSSLLLVSEQGYGDTLQFMRYVHPLRQRGLEVRFCAPPKLHGLIQASGIDAAPLHPQQVHGQAVGSWLPLLSVPRHLGVSAGQPLLNEPYLHPGDSLRRHWQAILADEPGPIIALNWQGNPEHEKSTSKGRSLPLEALAPLARLEGVRFLSLQKGPGSEQLDSCSFRDRFVACQQLVSDTWDFQETAAIIASCQLVISSDTAAAHLAAGQGQITWLLLKQVPEWRWGLEGERSGWYPSLRLFRQRQRGNWAELIERVAAVLEQHLRNGDLPVAPAVRPLPPAPAPALPLSLSSSGALGPSRLFATGTAGSAHGPVSAASASQASDLSSHAAIAHYNQGLALQQRGELEAAIGAYRQALAVQAAFPEALGNLGVALQAQGQLDAAIAALSRAVQLRPDFVEALSNLGNAWQASGNHEQAIEAYHKALALRPDFAEAHSNLGTAYKDCKDYGAAEQACRRALSLRPDYPEALSNLGNVLQAQGKIEPAIDCYRRALALKPDYANAHYNLGIALKEQDQLQEAIAAYDRAIAWQPDYPHAHSNKGNAWQELGEIDKAIAAYQEALRYDPEHPAANKNLSMALLLKGDYQQGWPRYEWRFQDEPGLELLFARPSIPRWDGAALPVGQRLTLVGEQGLGDVLQFMRYMLPLRERGMAVSLCAVKKLHGLIQASGLDAAPLTPSQAQRLEDGCWLPLLSLPQYLAVSEQNPVVSEPYIHTTRQHLERWERIIGREPGLLVGLNWQGNPEHEKTNSKGRSLPLEAFAPLAAIAGVRFVSLQKGHGAEQLDSCSFRACFVASQAQVSDAWDFLDTAAIVAQCDLVISSDTALAHLAGGMGKATWLLLKDVPEWRWGLQGEQSGWYPSMRLFRQRRRGDWEELMQRVTEALQAHGQGAAAAAASTTAMPPSLTPLAHRSDQAAVLASHGFALQESGDTAAAIEAYRQALRQRPDFPEALTNLALALQQHGDAAGAIDCLQRALALQPGAHAAAIHYNLGNAYQQRGDLQPAIAAYQQAVQLRPFYPKAFNNLGVALQDHGDVSGAIAAYRTALQQQPDDHEAEANLAMALLLSGAYPEGWTLYNRRYARRQRLHLLAAQPQGEIWQGEALPPGRRLLLVAEQGLGDTLQFMRYLLVLQQQGIATALCADPKLHGLIRASGIDAEPLSPDQAQQLDSPWLPLLSLPQHLGVSPAQPLLVEPYIHTGEAQLHRWREQLSRAGHPLIGIHWQGNPDHETTLSRGRSLPLEALAPLAALPALTLVSLQKGPGSEQLERCSFRDRFVDCQELVNDSWDFLETAAIVAQCDLVITSDSALAHLAAGMGRPTWLLLRDVPEWRWGLQGDTSFWYPSLRLFRQVERGNWDELVQRLVLALQLHLGWALRPPATPEAAASPSPQELEQAEACFAARRWQEAERLYRRWVERGGRQALAFQRLGQLCGLSQRYQDMAAWIEQGLALQPNDPGALCNLGLAYQQLGELEKAIDSYSKALQLNSENAEAHANLGTLWQERGDLQMAMRCYRQALALQPQHPEALCNLGLVLQQQGDGAAARALYQQAISAQPALAKAHYNLGCLEYAEGHMERAIAAYRQAIELQPDWPEAFTSLGNACKRLGDRAAAIEAYGQALKLRGDDADTLCNLGNTHLSADDLPAAIACFERALAVDNQHALTLHNLGIALQQQGELPAAIAAFRRCLDREPGFAEAHGALAMALLLTGDYPQGWVHYEWRFQSEHGQQLLVALPDLPRWDGSPLAAGSQLLLVAEQGLGDTLQFLRYGLELERRGLLVSLCAPAKLHGLIQASVPQLQLLLPEQVAERREGQWIPLLSLPGVLGVRYGQPLVSQPYLRSHEALIARWRSRLAGEQRPIVAINWQGNPDHEQTTSRGRSLPLEAWAPLAAAAQICLLSLQKGHGSEQLARCSFRDRFVSCQDQIDATWDFLETAAIIANCDLVISSDTAVAHLAAAMGKPTWLLLQHTPEWRWGLAGEQSFWYPSMRLFRQRRRGDWQGVIEALTSAWQQVADQIQAGADPFASEAAVVAEASGRLYPHPVVLPDGAQRALAEVTSPLAASSLPIAIPTLNQYPLLERLCRKIVDECPEAVDRQIIILDNGGELQASDIGKRIARLSAGIQIVTPAWNLGVAGSWNVFANRLGRCIIANDDVVFGAQAIADLESAAAAHPDAIIIENDHPVGGFSTFVLNRPQPWIAMGGFDENFNPAYFEDDDTRIRLKLAGIPPVAVHLRDWHHDNSSTLRNADRAYQRQHWCTFKRNQLYYHSKWGGPPGAEAFQMPFNAPPRP